MWQNSTSGVFIETMFLSLRSVDLGHLQMFARLLGLQGMFFSAYEDHICYYYCSFFVAA